MGTFSERRLLVQPECRGGCLKGLLRDVMGIYGLSLRSHFFAPHRDTFVMTMARMMCVTNTLRIFRGYFNRKRVRRKNVCVYMFQILQNVSFLFVTIFNVYYPLMLKYNSLVTRWFFVNYILTVRFWAQLLVFLNNSLFKTAATSTYLTKISLGGLSG